MAKKTSEKTYRILVEMCGLKQECGSVVAANPESAVTMFLRSQGLDCLSAGRFSAIAEGRG